MRLIVLITENKSISFFLMRLNNRIMLYEATMVNIKFCILFKPIKGRKS